MGHMCLLECVRVLRRDRKETTFSTLIQTKRSSKSNSEFDSHIVKDREAQFDVQLGLELSDPKQATQFPLNF